MNWKRLFRSLWATIKGFFVATAIIMGLAGLFTIVRQCPLYCGLVFGGMLFIGIWYANYRYGN